MMFDRPAQVELRATLRGLVGHAPVKRWVAVTVDAALRFHMAGEAFPLRHFLVSGPLGSGRRTAAGVVAQCLHALGLLPNGRLCEGWKMSRAGCVTFIDHVRDADENEV